MHYSISSERKRQRFHFSKNIEATYVDWQISSNLYEEFNDYKKSYTVKNDLTILGYSYFDILCELFRNEQLSIVRFADLFNTQVFYIKFKNTIYNRIYYEYEDSGITDYDEISDKSQKDIEQLSNHLIEIEEKNFLILDEFKSFILGFPLYLQSLYPKNYNNFKYVYNIISDDINFFKNTKVKSLDKYKFLIGSYVEKHSDSRGRTNDFIPAGMCHYGSHIFMNSEDADKSKFGLLWYKRTLKQTFYHEVGHALDYLYFNDCLLKHKVTQQRSSYNIDLLKCAKLNFRKFKNLSPKLNKEVIEWISYYCHPKITHIKPLTEEQKNSNSEQVGFSEKMKLEVLELFGDLTTSLREKIINTPVTKTDNFNPNFSINHTQYDYSRVLEETWSECFAFLFDWMKNGFCEYDKYIIKAGNSNDRIFIKIHYHSLMYMLNNFDWNKLNISYSLFLRRRVQIKKLLNYVNDMPLNLKKGNPLELRRKKYLKFNDILKG